VAVLYIVASWLILQVADVLSSLLPVPEWTGSLVFIFLALGFPLVMVFSWIYELTPEGLKREQEVDRSQSITHQTGRKINILIIVMLALAIGSVVADRLIPRRVPGVQAHVDEETSAPAPDRSIAVLPFVNMSSEPEQEYFSDGMSEELLNLLAKVPELTVASRTSAFSFKGKDVRIAEVASALNVSHVLEGSIRKAGDQVRITAQLIDARRDVHLWSATWDRTLDDVFAIQDEIASSVVDELKVTLLGQAPKVVETSPEAYNLFLQARHLAGQGSIGSMRQAVEMYREALAIDPQYVPAWNSLSSAYINLAPVGGMDFDEAYGKAKEAIDRVLEIDPENAEANSGLAWYYEVYLSDYEEAARFYTKAMELDPNHARVLNGVAGFLMTLERFDQSIVIYRKLIERDPVNAKFPYNMGLAYLYTGDFAAATEAFDKAVALSPGMVLPIIFQGTMAYLADDCGSALEIGDRLSLDTGDAGNRLFAEALCYPRMGRNAEGVEALENLEEGSLDEWEASIAMIHAQQGRPDEAFKWLDRSYELYGARSIVIHDPLYDPIRNDPRWKLVLEKIGVLPEELAAIEFDVKLPK
jgi:TolB-like protein/Tfp pilus assembly protein PilF